MIRIVVCMKQVIDPEAPVSTFRIDEELKRALPPRGTLPVLSPYDENALEAALKIKDMQEAFITVISLGNNLSKPILQKSLAAGADDLILLQEEAFENLDAYSTALSIAGAIKKMGGCDLVFCGRQASDTNDGLVGLFMAGMLEIPCITLASQIEINGNAVSVKKSTLEGHEIQRTEMPCLVTVGSEVGNLRLPTVKATMAARKKNPKIWKLNDIELEDKDLNKRHFLELFISPSRNADCEIIKNENPEISAETLAKRLHEEGLV